jgi:zinc D-Ala-D-Ala carboxypeptidase
VTVNSGFRSISYNRTVPGAASNSMHTYGVAADIAIAGLTTAAVYRIAESCGYSGLESWKNSWQHVDSRVEYPYEPRAWWWQDGPI